MSQFEYLTVLVSIILALGLSEILKCWANLIQRRRHVRFSVLHSFWTAFIAFMMVQFWWGFWNFREVEVWSLLMLLGILFETACLVNGALLLMPPKDITEDVDLDFFYFDNAKPFFYVSSAMLVCLSIVETTVLGIGLFHTENIIRITAACGVIFVGSSKNRKVHFAFPVIGTVLMVAFLFVTNSV